MHPLLLKHQGITGVYSITQVFHLGDKYGPPDCSRRSILESYSPGIDAHGHDTGYHPTPAQLTQQVTPLSQPWSMSQPLLSSTPVGIPLTDPVPTAQDCPRPVKLPAEGAPRSQIVDFSTPLHQRTALLESETQSTDSMDNSLRTQL